MRLGCRLAILWGLMAVTVPLAAPFEKGAPLPDLTLPSLDDGKPLSLADFRGERLVLHVFASW
jgi:hypothetical protein